jgi:hypothetical protein
MWQKGTTGYDDDGRGEKSICNLQSPNPSDEHRPVGAALDLDGREKMVMFIWVDPYV